MPKYDSPAREAWKTSRYSVAEQLNIRLKRTAKKSAEKMLSEKAK